MAEQTQEKLVRAIESLADKSARDDVKADEALKYTQAALNAANAACIVARNYNKND